MMPDYKDEIFYSAKVREKRTSKIYYLASQEDLSVHVCEVDEKGDAKEKAGILEGVINPRGNIETTEKFSGLVLLNQFVIAGNIIKYRTAEGKDKYLKIECIFDCKGASPIHITNE